jgi:dolichol-phosphate mannosyltransferase
MVVATRRVVAVVPTYNESETIARTLRELLAQPCRPDVIVVDDNSPDGTAEIVFAVAGAADGRVRVVEGSCKRGIGRAYAHGFREALQGDYDVVVQLDADGSHPAQSLGSLVDVLSHADLAIGSRYVLGGGAAGLRGSRLLLSRAGNGYARALLRIGVHDLTGGFKAWRRDTLIAADAAAAASGGYGFQIEMTLRAARQGARISEVPIQFMARRAGESKMDWRIAAEAFAMVPRLARSHCDVAAVPRGAAVDASI